MKLHKMVNGKKIELSDEEEAKVRAEWAENAVKNEEKRQKRKSALEKQKMLKEKFASLMGCEVSDIDLMMGKSNELFGD